MNIFGYSIVKHDEFADIYKRINQLEKDKFTSVSGIARDDAQLLLGASYTVLEVNNEAEIWGLIDISSLLKGDSITVEMKSKRNGDDFKLVDSQEYTVNKNSSLVVFKPIRLPSIQIIIHQDKGISRKIGYQFKWNYL